MIKNKINKPMPRIIFDKESLEYSYYQKIQVDIDAYNLDKKFKVIGFLSILSNEGKTTSLVNLANSFSLNESKVLIIDLEFSSPKLHFYFNIPNENGICEFLSGNLKEEALIKKTKYDIDVINTGKIEKIESNYFESKKLDQLINKFREVYDYIFINVNPLLVNNEIVSINRFIDTNLLIVKNDKTRKDNLEKALDIINSHSIKILGSIYTNDKLKKQK